MIVSIVISFYNSQENCAELLEELGTIMTSNVKYQFELLIVDDGSFLFDLTIFKRFKIPANSCFKIIQLNKNYGQITAILTGLHYAKGEVVVIMSSDLQDPPELINDMLQIHAQTNCEMVACVRNKRKDSIIRKLGAYIWYRIVVLAINPSYPKKGGDYALINRRLVNSLLENKSTIRFLQNELLQFSKSTQYIEYERKQRFNKKSEWKIFKIVQLVLDILFTHTNVIQFFVYYNLISILVIILSLKNMVATIITLTGIIIVNLLFVAQFYRIRRKKRESFSIEDINKIIYQS